MTFKMNGLTLSNAAGGPATANISFPAAAIGLAPKTGAAIKNAPYSLSLCEARTEVLGWMVDVSTKILPFKELFGMITLSSNSINTLSSEI